MRFSVSVKFQHWHIQLKVTPMMLFVITEVMSHSQKHAVVWSSVLQSNEKLRLLKGDYIFMKCCLCKGSIHNMHNEVYCLNTLWLWVCQSVIVVFEFYNNTFYRIHRFTVHSGWCNTRFFTQWCQRKNIFDSPKNLSLKVIMSGGDQRIRFVLPYYPNYFKLYFDEYRINNNRITIGIINYIIIIGNLYYWFLHFIIL